MMILSCDPLDDDYFERMVAKRTEPARALVAGSCCDACDRPLTGRQRSACSPRCRAALSRQRRAISATVQLLQQSQPSAEVWRFRVRPAGRRFGWRGTVYASDRRTGVLEVVDPDFAEALRQRAAWDTVEELQ